MDFDPWPYSSSKSCRHGSVSRARLVPEEERQGTLSQLSARKAQAGRLAGFVAKAAWMFGQVTHILRS